MNFKLVYASALTIVIACNFKASAQTKKTTANKKPVTTASSKVKPAIATAQEIEEGKMLMAKSDCMACHHIENKLVGPSYTSVSEKYVLTQVNITSLSQKIISGGSGVWGTIPMPPHTALSATDAGKLVKYILTLNPKNLAVVSK